MGPGARYHHGRVYAVGDAQVCVERFDDEPGPGAVRVALAASPDATFTPADARRLAALLLAAADEGERR